MADDPQSYPSGVFSPASYAAGAKDGRRDSRDALRADDISPYVLDEGTRVDDGLDMDMEAIRAEAASAGASPSPGGSQRHHHQQQRRRQQQQSRSPARGQGITLRKFDAEALLERDVAIPNAVWTLGQGEHGQRGHSSSSPDVPRPAPLDLQTVRSGVRTVCAGPHCTLVVVASGEVLGFGAGPFRSAANADLNNDLHNSSGGGSSSRQRAQQQQQQHP